MKKVLALVLSVLMVLSLSVVAFADEVEKPETPTGSVDIENGDDKYDLGFGDLGAAPGDADPDKPGATYYYTILDKNDPDGMLTNGDIAKHLTVSIKESGDKMIDSYSIVKQNGVYKVKVVTKETYTTDKASATWSITLKKDKKFTVANADVSITQKWVDLDSDGDAYGEVEVVVNNEVVDGKEGASYDNYTDDANCWGILTLNKSVKYAEIFFEDSPVWYSVKNVAKSSVNVIFEESVNKTLATTYEDADLYAITFKGAPEFDMTGILHASVDEDMYVYAVIGGKLVADKFTWNKDAECWEYNTKSIEGVVVSDIKLDVSKYNSTVDNGTDGDKDNPGTGSVDFVNVAVALGVVSLAAAGAVALKK